MTWCVCVKTPSILWLARSADVLIAIFIPRARAAPVIMAESCCGLARVSYSTLECGDELTLRLSVALPLDRRGPPEFILYLLDPEPELFALATAHVYGRYSYIATDDDPEASVMRRCALVGIGHEPSLYAAGAHGFSTDALRTLRRRHFRDDLGGFRETLCSFICLLYTSPSPRDS